MSSVAQCVTVNTILPHPRYAALWSSIVVADEVKDRLFNTCLLALRLRGELPFDTTALHGLGLLYGPPGTGKTTLARGLAYELCSVVAGNQVRVIEINPHGLMSAEHGQSQQHVIELLCEHVPRLADDRLATVVVLDEVESMCVARNAASLSANPADVHRATDAVLTALDRNTADHPHLLTVATSNFADALDDAFKSRADVAIEIPVPDADAIAAILAKTLNGFSVAYPPLARLAEDPRLNRIASRLVGADGRQVRKLVTEALALRLDTVMDPGALTAGDLGIAADRAGFTRQGGTHVAA